MKKQMLSEEVLKMQKRAGIITEGQYKKLSEDLIREFLLGNYAINPTGILERSQHVIELDITSDGKKHILKVKGPGKSQSTGYTAVVEETDLPGFEKGNEIYLTFGVFSKDGDGTAINYTNQSIGKVAIKTESIKIDGKKVLPMPEDANNTGSQFYKAFSAAKEKTKDPLAMFDDYSVLEK